MSPEMKRALAEALSPTQRRMLRAAKRGNWFAGGSRSERRDLYDLGLLQRPVGYAPIRTTPLGREILTLLAPEKQTP